MYIYISPNSPPDRVGRPERPLFPAVFCQCCREKPSLLARIPNTLAKVRPRVAKVTCFIGPLATRVARILNAIEEAPPHVAKVTRFIGPLATRAGPGRPGVARGRPGLFRGPAEASFPRNASSRSKPGETKPFFNGAQDPIS